MKIIKKSKMKDGTNIQIENWKNDYRFIKTLSIAIYPTSKRTNETFRLELTNFKNDKEVIKIFEQLQNSDINLIDLKKYFRNAQIDLQEV